MTGKSPLRQSKAVNPCDPVCDFCKHYDFNADENGYYTGDGRCKHPEHPEPKDLGDWCPDFCCATCGKTDDDYKRAA